MKGTIKRFMLFCEPCGYKTIKEESKTEEFTEVKIGKIQDEIPKIDIETKKLKEGSNKEQPRIFKCPRCGRGARYKEIPQILKKAIQTQEEEETAKEKLRIENIIKYKENKEKEKRQEILNKQELDRIEKIKLEEERRARIQREQEEGKF